MLLLVLIFMVSERIKKDIADQLQHQEIPTESDIVGLYLTLSTISSGDNTESFNKDVAAHTPVNETKESNDNEDLQLATKEIAKLKKQTEALKKQIFKWKNLSGDEIKNYIIQELNDQYINIALSVKNTP